MAKLSMNETTTFRWSFEEDVARYAAAGIPAIGVWRQKLSDCGQDRAIELLRQHELKVSHLQWAGGFTGSDGRSYSDSVEDAREALKTAAAIGTDTLIVYSGARAGHTHSHARRLIQSALTELVPLAEELEVTLAVEPMHPGCANGCTFLASLEEVVEVLEAVGRSQVKMVFDTYHLGQDPAILLGLLGHLLPFRIGSECLPRDLRGVAALVLDDVDQRVLRLLPVGRNPVANRFDSVLLE